MINMLMTVNQATFDLFNSPFFEGVFQIEPDEVESFRNWAPGTQADAIAVGSDGAVYFVKDDTLYHEVLYGGGTIFYQEVGQLMLSDVTALAGGSGGVLYYANATDNQIYSYNLNDGTQAALTSDTLDLATAGDLAYSDGTIYGTQLGTYSDDGTAYSTLFAYDMQAGTKTVIDTYDGITISGLAHDGETLRGGVLGTYFEVVEFDLDSGSYFTTWVLPEGWRVPGSVEYYANDAADANGLVTPDSPTGAVRWVGGIFRDEFRSGDNNDTIVGGDGGDTVYTNGGDDRVWAGQGDTGDDYIELGAGNDIGAGGAGDDHISAEAGLDTVYGGAGNDFLSPGHDLDRDVIWAGSGNDSIFGASDISGPISETLSGDVMGGGTGNDIIISRLTADTIYGGAGNDTINGEDGDSQIFGGDDDDLINSGSGNEEIFPGAGNDVIDFTTGVGDDSIGGFLSNGTNVIRLTGLVSGFDGDDWALTQQGDHVLIGFDAGSILLYNTQVGDLNASHFDFG